MLAFQIVSDTSLWFLLIAIPIAIALTWYFYKNDASLNEMHDKTKILAQILRFSTIFLLFILLLSPIFKWYKTQIKKPIIVVAIDQSESIKLNPFYTSQKNKILQFIKHIKSNPDYDFKIIGFGNKVRPIDTLNFSDKITNFSNLFEYIQDQYEFENLGAVLLFSDGIYNHGQNPLYLTSIGLTPIYSICLGDTSIKKDIWIDKLNYNSKVFTGNNIRIQVTVKANKLIGTKTKIHLLKDKEIIQSQPIYVNKNQYYQTFNFIIGNEKEGIYKYSLKIDHVEKEYSIRNNISTAIIQVSSDKRNIIIATNAPHPDIGAIKSALETNPSFKVSLLSPEQASDSIINAHAIILYQLPAKQNSASLLLKNIITKKTPTLFVIGTQNHLQQFNEYFPKPILIAKSNQTEDAYLSINKAENFFNLSDESIETIESYPPLLVNYGDYKLNPNADIVLYQKIKQIVTSKPLLAFDIWQENQKIGILFGEGLYRWRLAEFAKKQQNTIFYEFINKIALYLLANQKKERFIVRNQQIFNEFDPITFEAELYNKSYEAINNAEINISITSAQNKTYNFIFDKNNPYYALNAGQFPAGEYRWTAFTEVANEKFKQSGIFIVHAENIETINTIADLSLMQQLAIRTGGQLISIDSLQQFTNIIKNNPNIIPISQSEENFTTLIDFKWILIVITLLIGIEWFLRRYFGSL